MICSIFINSLNENLTNISQEITELNSDLSNLTKNLSYRGNWTQNMDVAPGNYNSGAYWVTSVNTDDRYVEGTHAFTGTFYNLFVFPNNMSVQFAVRYDTGEIKSRCYVNSKWYSWTSDNVASATKLANARNIQTNLASTSAASFNGTANVTPGVTGKLGIGNGGTGATSAAVAMQNLAPNHHTSPSYVYSMGSNGYAGGSGYSTIKELFSAMDLGSAAKQSHTSSAPSSGSTALITSGAVYSAMAVSKTTISSSYVNFTVAKAGNVKFIYTSQYTGAEMSSGNVYTIGTLSADFRPTFNISQLIYVAESKRLFLNIDTAGVVKISIKDNISKGNAFNLSFAYI